MFVANLKSAIWTKQTLRGVGGGRDRMRTQITSQPETVICSFVFYTLNRWGVCLLIYLHRWGSKSSSRKGLIGLCPAKIHSVILPVPQRGRV